MHVKCVCLRVALPLFYMADITVQPSAMCIVGVSVGEERHDRGCGIHTPLKDSQGGERERKRQGERGGRERERDTEGAGNWK